MRLPLRFLIACVKAYRWLISPLFPPCCRYLPTCSEYAIEALQRHGALKGSILSLRRLARCHPFSASGFDPVPPAAADAFKSPSSAGERNPMASSKAEDEDTRR
ncbi:MAG: membrane protein insertion efficiency factor YidD [Ectothiorhodospiraceae bacterium AqS1]|nr:membrane protein insertion efficiency factor YidD [Ectothiorhodospiraceae bacterium AqS1]